jgi:hypothetical protein
VYGMAEALLREVAVVADNIEPDGVVLKEPGAGLPSTSPAAIRSVGNNQGTD